MFYLIKTIKKETEVQHESLKKYFYFYLIFKLKIFFQIEAVTRELVLTNDQLHKVAANLLHEFKKGLSWDTHNQAKVKMFPTYVTDVPNGEGKAIF